jgi:peroxiredoxin Q/BCP
LRDDIDEFTAAGARVVTVAPDTLEGVAKFVAGNPYPFALLADTDHAVFDAYDVISTMMSLGQRPALFVVDTDGVVRFDSIGTQQWQIPTNENVLKMLSSLR